MAAGLSVSCIHPVTRLQVPVAAGLSVSCIHPVTRLQVPVAAGLSVLHTPESPDYRYQWPLVSVCPLYTSSDQTTGTSGRWSQCVCIHPVTRLQVPVAAGLSVSCIHPVTRLQVPVAAGLSVSCIHLVTRLQVPVAAGLSVLHTPESPDYRYQWPLVSVCPVYTQ